MDDRVTQVYLQLLHEIVEKRDVDLDLKKLESQLFNKTSQFLELEKNFYKLQAQHERLLRITIQQAENLDRLQKAVKNLESARLSTDTKPHQSISKTKVGVKPDENNTYKVQTQRELSNSKESPELGDHGFKYEEYIEPIPDTTMLQNL